jgi:hypothetical protein
VSTHVHVSHQPSPSCPRTFAVPLSVAAAYQASLLRAFKRTLEEGRHDFVIVDAPLTRAAQLNEFWAAGQAAGFEVMVGQLPDADNPQVGGWAGGWAGG